MNALTVACAASRCGPLVHKVIMNPAVRRFAAKHIQNAWHSYRCQNRIGV
jgi:hypothetical protein